MQYWDVYCSGYPGDSRIVLDLTGRISLYGTALVPSLILVRTGLEWCAHLWLRLSSEVMVRLAKIVS